VHPWIGRGAFAGRRVGGIGQGCRIDHHDVRTVGHARERVVAAGIRGRAHDRRLARIMEAVQVRIAVQTHADIGEIEGVDASLAVAVVVPPDIATDRVGRGRRLVAEVHGEHAVAAADHGRALVVARGAAR